MTTQLDPVSYVRVPKLDVAGAVSLAKILLPRVPRSSSPGVRKAVSEIEQAVAELESKWAQQVVRHRRIDKRPLARRLDVLWSSTRDRLATYAALPDGNDDRTRAIAIHDMLFPDGLAFLRLAYVREHAESQRRIRIIDERGLAKDLEQLIGERFVAALRDTHQAYGDALGINKALPPVVAIDVAEPLRALVDAIRDYALQLLALARHDPQTREAVGLALAPIDAFRAANGRRARPNDREEDEAEDAPIASSLELLRTGSG